MKGQANQGCEMQVGTCNAGRADKGAAALIPVIANPSDRGRRLNGGSGMADGSGGTVGSGRAGDLRAALALLGRIEASIDALRMSLVVVLEEVEACDEMPINEYLAIGDALEGPTRHEREEQYQDVLDDEETRRHDIVHIRSRR